MESMKRKTLSFASIGRKNQHPIEYSISRCSYSKWSSSLFKTICLCSGRSMSNLSHDTDMISSYLYLDLLKNQTLYSCNLSKIRKSFHMLLGPIQNCPSQMNCWKKRTASTLFRLGDIKFYSTVFDKRLESILNFFDEIDSNYPSSDHLLRLKDQLQVETLEELQNYISSARRIKKRSQLSEKDRSYVNDFIQNCEYSPDIARLYSDLRRQTNIPGKVLHNWIRISVLQYFKEKYKLGMNEKAQIIEYLKTHPTDSVPDIVKVLANEKSFENIPRYLLQEWVRSQWKSIQRKVLSKEDRQKISIQLHLLKQDKSLYSKSIMEICNEIASDISVSRTILYEIVREFVEKNSRAAVPGSTRIFLRQYLQQVDIKKKSVSELCSQLKLDFKQQNISNENVPPDIVNNKIFIASGIEGDTSPNSDYYTNIDRNSNFQKDVHNPDAVQTLLSLPNWQLYDIVYDELRKILKPRLTSQQIQAIQMELNGSPSINIDTICRKLVSEFHIPSTAARRVILQELRKRNRIQLPKEIKNQILNKIYKLETSHYATQEIRNHIENEFHIPAFQVTELIDKYNQRKKVANFKQRKAIKSSVRDWLIQEQASLSASNPSSLFEDPNFANLLERLGQDLNLPMYVIRKVVRQELVSLEKENITKENLEFVCNYIKTSNSRNIATLSKLIAKELHLSTDVIYDLVRKEVGKIQRSNFPKELKSLIEIFIQDNIDMSVSEICDNFQDQTSLLRSVLYDQVRNIKNKMERSQKHEQNK